MINQKMYALGAAPSAIRELFAYGLERKKEIGEENVFDFSIGNPSVPAPESVRESVHELIDLPACELHGYSPSQGAPAVKQTIAESITKRFGIKASASNIYCTCGAAAGIAITLAAVTNPGDEVIVPTPYFPEYATWAGNAECELVEVPCLVPSFQLDIDAIEAAVSEKTSVVIINSPNNPVGSVYGRESLEALAAMLTRKSEELDRPIYILSDEPYREITYGAEVPYIPTIYPRTIVAYSYSKSLSLPGERIGYIYVSDAMEEDREVSLAVAGAGRALGYVCAPVLWQRVIQRCIDEPSDVEAYRKNRELLTEGLGALGYEFVEPQGAFYLWVKALEDDAQAFSDRARDFELLIVASDSFGVPGWIRVSYCIDSQVITRSMPAWKALKESYEA